MASHEKTHHRSVHCVGSTENWKGDHFPFKTVLSLKPIIDYWHQVASNDQPVKAAYFQSIEKELKQKAPELLQPIEDFTILDKHRDIVKLVMSTLFPLAFQEDVCSAAMQPFQWHILYATPLFQRLGLLAFHPKSTSSNLDQEAFERGRLLFACVEILRQFYDMELDLDYPIIFRLPDAKTGLERYLKMDFDFRFIKIKKVGKLEPLNQEDKNRLLSGYTNLEVWLNLLPPDRFEFHGFGVVNAIDVTTQEVLSSLKNDLLEMDAITSTAKFHILQDKIRALLQRPALRLGLQCVPGTEHMLQEHDRRVCSSAILSDTCRYKCADGYAGTVYERAMRQQRMIIIDDLTAYETPTPVETEMIKHGVVNLVVAPLYHENKPLGFLELGSPNAGDINSWNAFKLHEVLSLFALALRRSMDEMNDRIEALIKEKCTALHPSVEWRFRQAALNYLQNRRNGGSSEMEEIVFKDVYPLYGMSDIRSSSTLRNEAIQADLIEHLSMAREIILLAHRIKPLPFLADLGYRIGRHLTKIEEGLASGDELTILEFLHREIEQQFDDVAQFNPTVDKKVREYRDYVDPKFGILYRRRKDFEDSVTQINDAIADYLDAEQEKAQSIFPHYFEKYKSDGVDHGIYIGASLVEDGRFSQLYLKSIRIWQLMLMCGVARKAEQIKPMLKTSLDTAHLILIQTTPLTIRFRYDEKKFDVDGAYNVRYEIMKKRIDKALIKGTQERLTQPGKIALVYSQPREAAEYREYIAYLQHSGYLTGEVDDLELEDLQGMHGLKALRVDVNIKPSDHQQPVLDNAAKQAVKTAAEVMA